MIKIFKFFIYVCIIVIPVVWLSNYPGEVNILWKNYLIETNALGLVTLILVLFAVIILFYRIYFYIKNFPRQFVLKKKEKNLALAQNTLSKISLALSKGDLKSIEKNARKIKKQLNEHVFSTFLIAQSAIHAKEYIKAEKYLNILKNNKDVEFIAYKNLAYVSIKQAKDELAVKFLKKAHFLDDKDFWVTEQLSLMLAKLNKWSEAVKVLKFINSTNNPLLFEKKAYFMVESGVKPTQNPDLSLASIPTVLKIIEFYVDNSNEKKALDVISKTWEKFQYLDMILIFFKQESYDVRVALRRFKKIYNTIKNVDTDETRLAIAFSAFEAKLWGKTKNYLQLISKNNIDKRVMSLWDRLSNSSTKIDIPNLPKKVYEDPLWSCSMCNYKIEDWVIKCERCGSIGSFYWPKSKIAPSEINLNKGFFLS